MLIVKKSYEQNLINKLPLKNILERMICDT